MKIAKFYSFELKITSPCKLPKWKGNILRGSIGYQLKKLVGCKDDCRDCRKLFSCPFGYLFKTESRGIVLRRLEGFSKPYVIKPPLEKKQEYNVGERINFGMVLFGDATRFESCLIDAIKSLCRDGFGFENHRGKLKLESVYVLNPFKRKAEILYQNGSLHDSKTWIRDSHFNVNIPQIFELEFLTPFRLIVKRSLVVEPDFKTLLTFILRRYSSIRYQYTFSELDLDVDKMLKAAERVRIRRSDLKRRTLIYKDKEEYYISGKIQYVGRTNRKIRKLLAFGQIAHVGKRASFGHGWYRVLPHFD
ncbi:hypothetical protein B6U96_11335 [Archaeoglobales archaeon ex4484_92]|nr:MAG: hypothetical protein B6U96_11335 [Archaeoglobales archaeon ex4484_92]